MIGKIVKGTSFSGCVNYVLKEDKSRLLKAVGVYGSPEEIAEQFELQTLLNDKVKNTVGHISLSFSAEDGDRIRDDDGLMLKIAHDYMKLMGIENTQFIIARHTDRDHPHCHIVYNRVDNDGCTISDKNDRYRNEKVCKMLTARYRLHFAEGKEHVNFMRLRHHDKVKYFIYHALKREVPNARSWSELRLALRKYGIDTQWKLSRTTGEMQGVKFTCDQLTFSGSKIDRQFSFLNIDQELRYNAPRPARPRRDGIVVYPVGFRSVRQELPGRSAFHPCDLPASTLRISGKLPHVGDGQVRNAVLHGILRPFVVVEQPEQRFIGAVAPAAVAADVEDQVFTPRAGVALSLPPAYPTQIGSKSNAKLQ